MDSSDETNEILRDIHQQLKTIEQRLLQSEQKADEFRVLINQRMLVRDIVTRIGVGAAIVVLLLSFLLQG